MGLATTKEEYAALRRIIVTPAPDHMPQPLVAPLEEGGGSSSHRPPGAYQSLWRFVRRGGRLKAYNLGGVSIVPFTERDRGSELPYALTARPTLPVAERSLISTHRKPARATKHAASTDATTDAAPFTPHARTACFARAVQAIAGPAGRASPSPSPRAAWDRQADTTPNGRCIRSEERWSSSRFNATRPNQHALLSGPRESAPDPEKKSRLKSTASNAWSMGKKRMKRWISDLDAE
jgi:hypothetical protein